MIMNLCGAGVLMEEPSSSVLEDILMKNNLSDFEFGAALKLVKNEISVF